MPFNVDLRCRKCGLIRTVMLKNSSSDPDAEDRRCPGCRSKKFERVISAVAYNLSNDPEVRSEMLKKRSLDHTIKTAPDNVERIIERTKQR